MQISFAVCCLCFFICWLAFGVVVVVVVMVAEFKEKCNFFKDNVSVEEDL